MWDLEQIEFLRIEPDPNSSEGTSTLHDLADTLVKGKEDPEVTIDDNLGSNFGQREEGGEEKEVNCVDIRPQFKFQRTKEIAKDTSIFQARTVCLHSAARKTTVRFHQCDQSVVADAMENVEKYLVGQQLEGLAHPFGFPFVALIQLARKDRNEQEKKLTALNRRFFLFSFPSSALAFRLQLERLLLKKHPVCYASSWSSEHFYDCCTYLSCSIEEKSKRATEGSEVR